jgi:hypothetical protein
MTSFRTVALAALLLAGASSFAAAQTSDGKGLAGGAVGNVGPAGGAGSAPGAPSNATGSSHSQNAESTNKNKPEGKEPPR